MKHMLPSHMEHAKSFRICSAFHRHRHCRPDDLDHRDLEGYGIDPDGPDPMPDGYEMDLALAALFKGIQGISAEGSVLGLLAK